MFQRSIAARGVLASLSFKTIAAVVGLILPAGVASAAVSLRFGSSTATVTPNVDPNFTVRLFLDSTAEGTVGHDYRLETAGLIGAPVSGLFRIIDRVIPPFSATSPYSDATAMGSVGTTSTSESQVCASL